MIYIRDSAGRLRDQVGRFARGVEAVPVQQPVLTQFPQVERLPPRLYETVADVMRGIVRLVYGVLVNSDLAYRENRVLQRQMRHDPDVMSPLFQREFAVALLDWDLVAEEPDDKEQVDRADKIKKLIISNLRRPVEFIRHLDDAVWFGPSALNMLYQRLTRPGHWSDGMVAPGNWVPFHADSLLFTETGGLGMRVGALYKGTRVPVWDGLGHLFDETERKAVVLHTWMPQGPDYEEYRQGRYAFAGRGLRDLCWFFWLFKQQALQFWMKFIERFGMGTRIGTYPSGNATAQNEMDKALRNLLGDVSVLIPDNAHETPGGKSQYAINILDPQGPGRQNAFADLIKGYLAGQIKEMIIGQTATTEATATGLGSDVGTRHAETLRSIIKYDARCLQDSLTHEFLAPLYYMNFDDGLPCPRWVFAIEEVDSEEFMTGVKDYVGLGGTVSRQQVRGRLGLEDPIDDSDVLAGREPLDPMGGFGSVHEDLGAMRERARAAVSDNGEHKPQPGEPKGQPANRG